MSSYTDLFFKSIDRLVSRTDIDESLIRKSIKEEMYNEEIKNLSRLTTADKKKFAVFQNSYKTLPLDELAGLVKDIISSIYDEEKV